MSQKTSCSVHSCKLHVIPSSSRKRTKAEAGPASHRPGHTITQGALHVPVWILIFFCLYSSTYRWALCSLIGSLSEHLSLLVSGVVEQNQAPHDLPCSVWKGSGSDYLNCETRLTFDRTAATSCSPREFRKDVVSPSESLAAL